MGNYKTDAIILKAYPYGEADSILTIFSRDHGKLRAIAKGVRRPKSRLRGGVQLFCHTHLLIHAGRSLDLVTQSEPRESFSGIQDSLDRIAYAAYIVELLEAMMPERQRSETVFLLTLAALHLVEAGDPELAARIFESRLLVQAGYRPHLENCVHCHQPVTGGQIALSPALGGIVCCECRSRDLGFTTVAAGTLAIWRHLLKMELPKLSRLKVSPIARQELEAALAGFIEYRLERRLKAAEFIKTVQGMPGTDASG